MPHKISLFRSARSRVSRAVLLVFIAFVLVSSVFLDSFFSARNMYHKLSSGSTLNQ